MIEVATPPRVATFTLETKVPVIGREEESTSIVCVAGPTILIGAGISSVMLKIWSDESGNARRKAQKKGEERVISSDAYINSHSPEMRPEREDACPKSAYLMGSQFDEKISSGTHSDERDRIRMCQYVLLLPQVFPDPQS